MGPENLSWPPIIVTIDGPAGSGKTTVSRMLARRMGYRYLDTGALYRAVAVGAFEAGVDPADDAALVALCRRMHLEMQITDDGARIVLNGTDVTEQLRWPPISLLASTISANPIVRRFLLDTQRTLAAPKMVVAEGRDMGTVVFPGAEAKFFLDADPGIRARRRFEELQVSSDDGPSLESVANDMRQRDRNDATRAVSPLVPAPDAIHIDASRLTPDQVVACMLDHISRIVSAKADSESGG